MRIAALFPGQGAQQLGMLAGFADHAPVRDTFAEASAALGCDLWALAQQGPDAELQRTVNTQPLMLTAGLACYRAWREAGGGEPVVAAGHSLGEFTACAAAGVFSLADAVRLVRRRAELMQACVAEGAGAMAAVIGLDGDTVDGLCRETAAVGPLVEAVNFNETLQTVVAGLAEGVAEVSRRCTEAGARAVMPLNVSAPFHTSLLRPAAEGLGQALAALSLAPARFPVAANVDGRPRTEPAEIAAALVAQACSPVHWLPCQQTVAGYGPDRALEFGPGRTLAGFAKRSGVGLRVLGVADPAGLERALEGSAGGAEARR